MEARHAASLSYSPARLGLSSSGAASGASHVAGPVSQLGGTIAGVGSVGGAGLRDRFAPGANVDDAALDGLGGGSGNGHGGSGFGLATKRTVAAVTPAPAVGGVHERMSARLRTLIGSDRYAGSFEHKALFRLAEGRLEVATPNKVLSGLLERRFADLVREAAAAELGVSDVGFVVAPDLFGPEAERLSESVPAGLRLTPEAAGAGAQVEFKPVTQPGQLKATPKHVQRLNVSDKHRLESLVVGESNRLAYNASVQMAEGAADAAGQPALSMLFIHGPCGVGKTHLAGGIALRYRERHPGASVRYVSAEAFMNDYVAAVRAGDVEKFRRAYRRVDLLCIDDVHFLSSKQSTQGELLHTLDEISRGGARVVIVSDEHPRQIRQFSAALVSRFMAGMVAQVGTPDAELRRKVVKLFAASRGLVLEDAAVELVVEKTAPRPGQAPMSVRDIEGLLTKIDAVHRLAPEYARGGTGGKVGVLAVERAMGPTPSVGGPNSVRTARPVRIETIIVHTCTALAIDAADLSGKTRHKRVVAARAIITHLARQFTPMSFPESARAIGRPNHSTVITALQRLQRQLEADEPVEAPGAPEARTLAVLVRQLGSSVQGAGR